MALKLLIDPWSELLGDGASVIGQPPLIPNLRLIAALPLENGPQAIAGPQLIVGPDGSYLGDPEQGYLGQPPIIVHRLLAAASTEFSG